MTEKVTNTAFTLKPSTIKILKETSSNEGLSASRIADRILRSALLGETSNQQKMDLVLEEVRELKLLLSEFIK